MKRLLLFFALVGIQQFSNAQCVTPTIEVSMDSTSGDLCQNHYDLYGGLLIVEITGQNIDSLQSFELTIMTQNGDTYTEFANGVYDEISFSEKGEMRIVQIEDLSTNCITPTDERFEFGYFPEQFVDFTATGDFCAGDNIGTLNLNIYPKSANNPYFIVSISSDDTTNFNENFIPLLSLDTQITVNNPGYYYLDDIIGGCIDILYAPIYPENMAYIKGNICYDLDITHPACNNADGSLIFTSNDVDSLDIIVDEGTYDIIGNGESFIVNNLDAGIHTIDIYSFSGDYEFYEIELKNGASAYTLDTTKASCSQGDGSISLLGLSVPDENVIWNNGKTGKTLTNVYPGYYEAIVEDPLTCTDTITVLLTDLCGESDFATVKGYVYNDVNKNGTKDIGEEPIPSKYIYIQPGGYYDFSNLDGYYEIQVPLGLDYNVHINPGKKFSCSGRYLKTLETTSPLNATHENIDLTVRGMEVIKSFGIDLLNEDCITLSGSVFNDKNGNGIKDVGEGGVDGVRISIINQTEGIDTYAMTDGAGNFQIEVPASSSDYEITLITSSNSYYYCSNTFKDTQTFPSNGEGYLSSTDVPYVFGLQRATSFDVGIVAITAYQGRTPGELFYAWMDFKGNGNFPSGCDLRLNFDDHLKFISSTLTADVITDTYVEWQFSKFGIPSGFCNKMNFQMDANTPNDYTLTYFAEYVCNDEDACPANDELQREVATLSSGSSLKTTAESEVQIELYSHALGGNGSGDITSSDTTLSYTVSFKNIGKDSLYHLMIRDTLPDNIQFEKVSKAFSSHPYEFSFVEPNVLQWEFKELEVPGSDVNELESYGFLQFNIITTPLAMNEVVEKEIAVTFNENETYTATSNLKVTQVTATEDPITTTNSSNIFPNPSTDIINIDHHSTIEKITIHDISGLPVKTINDVGRQQAQLDIHDLNPGMYLIQVQAEEGSESYKIVVE